MLHWKLPSDRLLGGEMKKLRAEDAIKGWDNNADKFASYVSKFGDDHRVVLLTFRILDILGDVQGLHVLDAGCGEGEGTLEYASGNNVILHGADFSETRLSKANSLLKNLEKEGRRVFLLLMVFIQKNCKN